MDKVTIRILNREKTIETEAGTTLLKALTDHGIFLDAPCGGEGKCKKCVVILEGKEVLACRIKAEQDMEISLPESAREKVVQTAATSDVSFEPLRPGYQLAFDIGTTTVVGYLLDKEDGRVLCTEGILNPQTSFGADVISRIKEAMNGSLKQLTSSIRKALTQITLKLCDKTGIQPEEISTVCVVGNPCMQQLFMGLDPSNLATIPFAPVLTQTKIVKAETFLPILKKADFLVVPDISGYVGADTLACVMSTQLYKSDDIILMLDIGTNGEMVLGSKERMAACSTAAGPALEGADIRFGMRAKDGAIDHVLAENNLLSCHVMGEGKAEGLCGSGLIDAVAKSLVTGHINEFGRIQDTEEKEGGRFIPLKDDVFLTQEDIRKVQLAKGAIAAGIKLMAEHLGISFEEISHVYLAGAFGSYIDPVSACEIGLIPEELLQKTTAIGNAAGAGSCRMAKNHQEFLQCQEVRDRIEFLELASLAEFQYEFVEQMNFPDFS